MKQSPIIRRLLAVFLCCVFVLSTTPKRYLHDMVTHHNHTSKTVLTNSSTLEDGNGCHYEDFVANAAFLQFSWPTIPPPVTQIIHRQTSITVLHFYTTSNECIALRGPPAA